MRGRNWIAIWGVLGVAATFVDAIARLGARAVMQLSGDVSAGQWAALGVLTIVMTYVEGHHALQRRFAPSVVARALEVGERDRALWALLAPLYAVSLIGAAPRVIARSALGLALIVGCVVAVRGLPAPWRGIIDGAVGVALAWGLVALLACFASALGELGAAQRAVPARDGGPTTFTREAA